ncbi:poly-beta-1,6-N-acetyl-D-glucosamine N-deacetylase PgaB [Hahella ganghwensis]|uniref:poly-beta-1,6-N-acetyl-D-glucosamine N-deacetylase PgaB n=1 Tax=Hahella ganghwensis TaxID=286420 RepID=UPI00039C40AC|nr:poly-beta-1,6-N-acetyl-D-glucosamine N-deacetylase PgaB [Hahella ganghwensis]
MKQYNAWDLGLSIEDIRKDKSKLKRWSQLKTDYLIYITRRLAARSNRYFASDGQRLKLARNIYAQPVLNPESETWYAQNLEAFAEAYDDVAVMAMPFMEQQNNPEHWLRKISRKALERIGPEKLVFELQATDWRTNKPIPDHVLKRQMQVISEEGIESFGYYPDDFISGVPNINVIKPALSINSSLGAPK